MTGAGVMLTSAPLPVEVVFHPSRWHKHAGISFDEDFFYHPARRIEAERRMEQVRAIFETVFELREERAAHR